MRAAIVKAKLKGIRIPAIGLCAPDSFHFIAEIYSPKFSSHAIRSERKYPAVRWIFPIAKEGKSLLAGPD
jgi:hypothetical protein